MSTQTETQQKSDHIYIYIPYVYVYLNIIYYMSTPGRVSYSAKSMRWQDSIQDQLYTAMNINNVDSFTSVDAHN